MSEFLMRDFHGGVYRKAAISNFLAPPHTVAHSLNVIYDEIIGSAKVRGGTTKLGATVAAGRTPLGLSEFAVSASTNVVVGVYTGASNASIYYYNNGWNTSAVTNLSNTAKNRFAVLGNRIFRVNGVDAMASSSNGNTWSTLDCMTARVPSLVLRTKNRLITSGDASYRSRVWFSSIIDPTTSPFITWNENASTGDFIDVNPDDGDFNTAFADTSAVVLVFKNYAMYRLNTITKTVDTDNIFNVGAVSQEAVTQCQGVTYFFSGLDIRRTTGDFPEQISRLGVQDFINAIPQTSWTNVGAGTDSFNVYFSIGNVTLNTGKNDQVTYKNVVLKFSPRDESWSIHVYGQQYRNYCQFTTSAGRTMLGAETSGNVQTVNSGYTDNGVPIFYELITHEQDFGNRAHTNTISDKLVVYCQNGADGSIQIQMDKDDFKNVDINLNTDNGISVSRQLSFRGNYATFRWYGNCSQTPPIFGGFQIENIGDEGITT